jgi:hypothetical protein
MKRTAAEAFAPAVPAAGVFQPGGKAMFDPKAYFAQFQQAAMQGQALAPPGTVVPPAAASTAPAPGGEVKSELQQQIESASAIKCAAIIKDKGVNFTTAMAIEALSTMATKSSFKLREELLKQQHVKKLCERVRTIVSQPPAGMSLETLSRAAWCLVRFPNEVLGDSPGTVFGPLAQALSAATVGSAPSWHANTAARILHCLAKADFGHVDFKTASCIMRHKHIVTQVVKELCRDVGRRVAELSQEELVNMLTSIAKARVHIPGKSDSRETRTIRLEANDELYFQYASKRIIDEVERMDVKLVADVAHVHSESGVRDEKLFKAICPRIVSKSKELDEKAMGRCVKAYTRFMIPLREEAQGFRTMAVVAKGDFIRPSEKPKRTGPKTYDHPVALYGKTQVHTRG